MAWIGGLAAVSRAQLITVNETFTGTTLSSGWVATGSNYTPTLTAATGIDAPGSGWLRLTDTGGSEATSVRDTNAFTSANATIAVKFNYAAYGGTGADGITFFLADASKTFATGAYGGSLGYANMSAGTTQINGMAGGYIGLGLDEYGNFATMNEGKHGGFGTSTNLNAYPNAVSVRGPGSGQTGYDYLGGTAPFTPPFAFPSDTTRPTGTEARTFQVIITATNQLTVYMQAGANAPMLPLYSIDLSGYARPDTLIMGFTGSSGGLTDIHEVQGLYLSSLVATLWTNGAGTGTWSTSSNWNGYGGTIPAVGADVLLDNHYVNTAQTIDVGTNRSIRSLQIDAPFSYTLNNGSIELNSQGILGPVGIYVSQGHGAATHTINSDLIADESFEIKNLGAGALNVGGTISLDANTLTVNGSGTGVTTLGNTISGTGNLVKNDSGTVVLGTANTYSGGTTINAGNVTVSNNQALGTGAVTLNGGTLASNATNTVGNILTLQGNAGLSNITTSGTLTQTGGNFTLDMAGATHSGIVNLSSTTASGTLTVNVDSGTSTISGLIQNGATPGTAPGSLTKTGTGTLVLSGNNTYTGTTTISVGTLTLGGNNVLANTSGITIGSSGTLDLAGHSQQIGTLAASGGATINFGPTGTSNTFVFGNYTAPTSGVLVISNFDNGAIKDQLGTTTAGLNVSSIYISGQGVAQLAGNTTLTMYGNAYLITPATQNWTIWSGSNTTWNSGGTGGNWSGAAVPNSTSALAQLGTGTANPDLGGNRTLNGLRFAAGAQAYNITGTGSTLTMDSPVTGGIAFIQQQATNNQTMSFSTLALNKNTVVDITAAGNLTISSAITGATNLVKDGTGAGRLILTGSNTGFTGGVFVNNGILQAANTNALGTGTATVYDGATLELAGGIAPTNAVSVTGAGFGGIGAIHNASGANTLSGTITATGATSIVADGTSLTLSGNLTGTNQDLTFAGTGNLNVARITTGTGNVTLNGTGTVTFNGTTNANTYTGTTSVNSGTLILNKSAGTNAIAGDLVIGDGVGAASSTTVQLGAANQIANTSQVTVNSDGRFDLNGKTETVGSISGSGLIDNTSATATTLTVGDTSVTTFTGTIQDTGGALALYKQGTGKLTLTGNNNYSGNTTLANGIIAVQSNTALGTSTLIVNSGGNLEVAGGITVANAMFLNGNGTQANDGAIQSTAGANTLGGAGNITLQSASRIQADSGSSLTVAKDIVGTGMGITFGGGGNIVVTGNIATGTAGTLTKDGSGYLVLNPTANGNTFTGATAINDGTLEIQKSSALGTSAGGVNVASGGTLAISGGITTAESPVTLNGAGDNGTGALRNISGSNTVSGAVTLNSATTIASDAGTLTLSGVVAGAAANTLTKIGAGTVTMSGTGANTFTGNIAVNDGTLVLNKTGVAANAGGSVTVGDSIGAANSAVVQLGGNSQLTTGTAVAINSDGKLDVNGKTQTIASLADGATGGGTVALGTGTLTVGNANSTTFSGAVAGTGTLVKTGTGTLTLAPTAGSNAFAPSTLTISQGTVQLGASNILATAVNFNGGTLSVNGFSDTLNSATVSASSILDFNNLAGILNLTNATWTAGTLTINNWAGSFTGGGASQVLLPGTITGSLLANITFAGFGAGAQLVGNEIVPLTGTSYTWNVNADGNWTTNANWNPSSGNPNGIGQTANFTSAITANHTVTLDAARTVGYLNFNDDNNYTIASATNRLTFDVSAGNAQLNVNGTGSQMISAGINLNDALVINQNSTGTLTLSNANAITGTARNLTVNGSGNTTIGGVIATTTGSLTKNNGGTLTLGGANTYTGGTTINGGTIAIGSDGNLGGTSGALTLNGGTLQSAGNAAITLSATRAVTVGANGGTFRTDANLTYNGALAGTGTLIKEGAGSFTTGGANANTRTGDVAINAGTLEIAKSGAVSALGDTGNVTVAAGATLKFNGSGTYTGETIGNLAGAGTVTNASASALSVTVGSNGGNATFSGVIQNTGGALSLTKTGAGTLTLTGNNSYSGTTTVSQGVLNIQSNTALGNVTAGTTVASGAALEVQGGITVGTESLSLNGTGIGGNGALRNVSDNNSISGAITLAGATTIRSEAGTLTLNGAIGGAAQNLTLDGPGNLTLAGALGTTTGTLTKNGSGYAILSGSSTFTGATSIAAGTLEIQNAGALGGTGGGTTVTSGATLALGGAGTSFNAEPLTLNGAGVGSAGALRNVSGNNTYRGSITLGSSSIVGVDTGTTLATNTGVISGAAGVTLTKTGGGTLVLGGANTYSGATNIVGGTVQISTDANLGTAPAAATAAQLTLNGGTLNTTATMTLNTNRGVSIGAAGATIDTNAGTTLTYNGIVAGASGSALNKAGSGTLVLGGANTYDGATNINGGNVSISSNANLGETGGTVNINGNNSGLMTTATLTSNRTFNLNGSGSTLAVTAGTLTQTGTVNLSGSGANAITVAGGANFNAAVTFGGAAANSLTISSGSVTFASSLSLIGSATNTLNVNAGSLTLGGIVLGTGTNTLNVATGASVTFGGVLSGSGSLAVTSGGALTFNSTLDFSNANLTLSGGSLTLLAGANVHLGSLTITGNTLLDFANSGATTLSVGTLTIIGNGTTVTVNNWVNTSDYFYSDNFRYGTTVTNTTSATTDVRNTAPENQINFTGFSSTTTVWQGYDHQITPAPEPSAYGVILLGTCLGFVGYRRWRRRHI